MPNNAAMNMTDQEIVAALGGVTAVAHLLGIKPPSVHGWIESGIPEVRLIQLAGQIEAKTDGRFSRRARWPDKYGLYWPELAPAHTTHQPVDAVAQGV